MNYYKPRQREFDFRWDYTSMNDGHVTPVGYCRPWRDWDEATKKLSPTEYERYVADKEKYHDHGHATAQEAANCYRNYILDHGLTLNHKDSNAQHKCEICGEWTQGFAILNNTNLYMLCDLHNNRESVETLYTLSADTEIISSW